MRIGVCVGMCTDMCMDMCMDMRFDIWYRSQLSKAACCMPTMDITGSADECK